MTWCRYCLSDCNADWHITKPTCHKCEEQRKLSRIIDKDLRIRNNLSREKGWVYLLPDMSMENCKIGFSSNPGRRFAEYRSATSYGFTKEHLEKKTVLIPGVGIAEDFLHAYFKPIRIAKQIEGGGYSNEWYSFIGEGWKNRDAVLGEKLINIYSSGSFLDLEVPKIS